MKRPCSSAGVALLATFSLCTWPRAASAGEVEEILAKIDRAQFPAKDQVAVMKMTLKDKAGNAKVRELSSKQLGARLRLVRFQTPAEVKGVSFLSRGDEEMYIYMPEFGKVRRIASHTRSETFMGSDFSYDDIGSAEMAEKNVGRILKREGDLVTLELVPKKPDDSALKRSVVVVDTRYHLVVKSDQYDKNGKLWKTLTQEDIRQVSGYWLAHRITMQNVREGSATVMELSEARFDIGLADDDFSQRNMKRSN
jgi:outer membrane lipoprotein-sorting protein